MTPTTQNPSRSVGTARPSSIDTPQIDPRGPRDHFPEPRLKRALAAVIIAWAAAIPVSVALANVLLGLLLLLWLVSGSAPSALRQAWRHPVARMAIILVAVLTAGTLHGLGTLVQRWNMLGKYLDLLLLAPLLQAFRERPVRRAATFALLAAMALTLAVSYLIAAGVLPRGPWFKAVPGDASVFKDHITQSILMAFAAFLWVEQALRDPLRRQRIVAAVLAVLAVIDIFFWWKAGPAISS